MNVRPAGREPCSCSSPINQILERLDQMDADIASAQQAANTAVGTANTQAGVAAASAASAAQDASDALGHAAAAQQSADDALLEATNAAGHAQDAADDLADALLAVQNIEATIASVLANDIGAKVDKLTTAGFHIYTHNGSTQGEVAPDINPTAATIPIRDSSGKLFGADPASGATDKTLTTANWISQTGNSAPNNLVHRSGDETFSGTKTSGTLQKFNSRPYIFQRAVSSNNWFKMFEFASTSRRTVIMDVIWSHQSYNLGGAGRVIFLIAGANTIAKWVYRYGNDATITANCVFVGYKDGKVEIWVKSGLFTYAEIARSIKGNVEETISDISIAYDGTPYASIDTTQYTNYAYGTD